MNTSVLSVANVNCTISKGVFFFFFLSKRNSEKNEVLVFERMKKKKMIDVKDESKNESMIYLSIV